MFALAGLSLVARIYNMPFSYGISFTFGNLFIYIILRYYGVKVAVITALVANVTELCFFNSNIYTIIFTAEVLVVGLLWKDKKTNLFLRDILFWLVIGVPASFLMFYINRRTLGAEGVLIIINNIINGILNVLVAEIIMSYVPIKRIFGQKQKNLTDLGKMMFHITIAAVVGFFMVYIMIDGWLAEEKLNSEIHQILNTSGSSIMEQVKKWEINDLRKIRLRSPLHLKNFETIVRGITFNDEVEVLLEDKNNNIYVTNQPQEKYDKIYNWKENGEITKVGKNAYRWMPVSKRFSYDFKRWNEAFYITIFPFENNMDLQLLVKVPLSNYTKSMWENYLNKFVIFLFFCFVSMLLSLMMSRLLSNDLLKLTISTTGLPEKLKRQETIEWPDTSVAQVNSLVSNFKVMSDNLIALFAETKIMNSQLLAQTKELEDSREKMKRLAYYDTLTDLPNRLFFTEHLQKLLDSAEGKQIAVMFIDLNRFKQINDTLGHEVGDMLIRAIANRLKSYLKEDSFVARLGGDEFVIVLNDTDKRRAMRVAISINRTLTKTIKLSKDNETHELYVSGSIGISMYPNDANEKSALLKNADLAMYAAKETGENTFRFYSDLAETNMSEQLFLEQSLNKALERDEIIIEYQPKVDIRLEKIIGAEALIRWKHPQKGLIPPSQFITLAEETGIINQIGEWVLIEACKQNKKWQESGYPKIRISVNLSFRQFYGNNFIKTVLKALDISGLSPKYLELEITEGFLVKNTKYAISVLEDLSEIGVSIAIDDFGTGYSSLGRLKELPINSLKIDRSFIKDITHEKNNAAIVSAIVQLAHSMGLSVVAEGVETVYDLSTVKALDCDEIQGYLISKAIPEDEFGKMIDNFIFPSYPSNNYEGRF